MFKTLLKFEAKRLFTWRNIKIFFAFFILLCTFSWDGINDFKMIQSNKEPFKEMERDKVSMHIHYTFYGIRGVRLLFIPCPISVIFNDSAVFKGMTAHVDTAENLNISNSFKGKDLFSGFGGYMDFGGIIFLIGSFLSLLYGYDGTRSREYLRLLSDISGSRKPALSITLARVILFNMLFLGLCGLSLLWLLINGINAVNVYYCLFAGGLCFVITFFISTSALIGSLKNKSVGLLILLAFYFLFVFFIPWVIQKAVYIEAKTGIESIHKFEYKSFKYVMDLEKRLNKRFGVWKSGNVAPDEIKAAIESGQDNEYKKLRKLEMERFDSILKRIRAYQTVAAFFPSTFYLSLNKELSSKGFQNFVNFYRHAYEMKYKFIEFYIDRKFYRPLPKSGVEPFIKENEDYFFLGQSHLPKGFLLGFGLTVFYITVLLFILSRIQLKEPKRKIEVPGIDFKEGQKSLFVLCENEQIKNEIFWFYESQGNAACIDKINLDVHFDGIRARTVMQYFCKLSGMDERQALENLKIMGVENLREIKQLSRELILKIYAAVKTAAACEYIVLNDFLKGVSRELERSFLDLLSSIESTGKKIIYLSTEMYNPVVSFNESLKVDNFGVLDLPLKKITLR